MVVGVRNGRGGVNVRVDNADDPGVGLLFYTRRPPFVSGRGAACLPGDCLAQNIRKGEWPCLMCRPRCITRVWWEILL